MTIVRHTRLVAATTAVLAAALSIPAVQADDITSVEGARAKDRQGAYLTRQDREQLRRHGNNDDYGYRGGYGYGYGSYGYGGPSVGIYIGPGPRYYDPYGY